ncbi:hypothetical protein HK099_000385 [Clydaea vesicula]|uniref:Oligopeptide transporter n=1 Tax=Clydaea vesicula TaxID=447962 RepID=A0AAD5U492_9FUNG|nr:hypothetical protein HK099_000385 [Clydaea vesicula]
MSEYQKLNIEENDQIENDLDLVFDTEEHFLLRNLKTSDESDEVESEDTEAFAFGEEEKLPASVAAVVSEFDEDLPCLTFPSAAQFFFFRLVGLILTPYIIQMISFPLGKFMERVIPEGKFNPGKFNVKEHVLICVSASTASAAAYGIDILTVQRIYYNQNIGIVPSLILLITTQCIGYGLAGFLQDFLVKPAKMIWPIVLSTVAVYNTLHEVTTERGVPFPNGSDKNSILEFEEKIYTKNISSIGPSYVDGIELFPIFNSSYVLFDNLTLNEARYKEHGPLLLSPWWSYGYGALFATLTATISWVYLFHGSEILKILKNLLKNKALKRNLNSDIHCRLMKKYDKVPKWWYLSLFFFMLFLSIFNVEILAPELQIRWWGICLGVLISSFFALPVGIIKAITGTGIGLNVLTEMIMGYIKPGEPISNICFKTYGYMTMSQGLSLVEDGKLGHYMKIPPKKLFLAQLFGTIIGSITNLLVMELILKEVDFKNPNGDPQWSARKTATFYQASLIWGAVGPAKLFGGYYKNRLLFFLIGLVLPVIIYLLHRKYPKSYWKYVNIPLILHATTLNISGAHMMLSSILIAISAHLYVKRNFNELYSKYIYVLGAGLDTGKVDRNQSSLTSISKGTTISVVICFLIFKVQNVKFWNWFLNPADGPTDYCYNSVQD